MSWQSNEVIVDGEHHSSGLSHETIFEACWLCEHQLAMMSSANLRAPSPVLFQTPRALVPVLAVLQQYWSPPHLCPIFFCRTSSLAVLMGAVDGLTCASWHGQFWDILKPGCPALGNLLVYTPLDRLCHRQDEQRGGSPCSASN